MDSYINELHINTSAQQVYDALTTQKGLASWWTAPIDMYPRVGGIATFRFKKEKYVVMKFAKLLPQKEVVWKCVEQHLPIPGTDKTDEWVGTTLKFSIKDNNDETTTLTFFHNGLTPQLDCFDECKNEWDYSLKSLKGYLESEKEQPFELKEHPLS